MARGRGYRPRRQCAAGLDVATALALLPPRPLLPPAHLEDSTAFDIKGGRHPVVEAAIEGSFVANDCNLENAQRLWADHPAPTWPVNRPSCAKMP